MGLDIAVYRKLVPTEDDPDNKDDVVTVWHNPAFPGRCDDVPAGNYLPGETGDGFRAGSYSGYSYWRCQLAALVDTNVEAIWTGVGGPFSELINFSDCEGALGTAICRKLSDDFQQWQEAADHHPDEMFRSRYANWRRACEFAADGGVMVFH